jgi:acetyltransferase-like isoleucine patch superfamily enzyme
MGKFCSIASSVTIAPGIHDLKRVTTYAALIQNSAPLPKVFALREDNIITSEKVLSVDVWIGEKVVVVVGKIGNGAVVMQELLL